MDRENQSWLRWLQLNREYWTWTKSPERAHKITEVESHTPAGCDRCYLLIWFEDLLERVEDTIQIVYNATINHLLQLRNRKIKIHIDEYDTWNMDNTLGLIALPMLKQLKATKHGAPLVDDEDVPEELRSTAAEPKENEWDTDSNHFKRWDWVMNEMIFAFEMEIDDEWDIRIWEKHNQNWTEEAWAEEKEVQDRISNGFRLFGKYYRALWD